MKTKILSVIAAASLAVTSFAALTITASADTYDLSNPYLIGPISDGDVLTGTLGDNRKITIADGATVTLRNVTISGTDSYSYKYAGITLLGSATIILEGENDVTGFYYAYPGIYVPEGGTLTIKGDGSLTARSSGSNSGGAGIGGGYADEDEIPCGNIVIESGDITAIGGSGSAGIGSGAGSSCGTITINGGDVKASGGESATGIGSGAFASCGDITITGGKVAATVTGSEDVVSGAGIGSGYYALCGDITITGGEVTATGGPCAAGIGSGLYSECGNITITDGVTSVKATKGEDVFYGEDAHNCIGAGVEATVGTITIGGVEGAISESPYTYEPVHAAPATATYSQVGTDYNTETGDETKDTASLWKVTVTPGDDTIETLSVNVNNKTPDEPLAIGNYSGAIVFGVVLNKGAADVESLSFTALVNGEAVETTIE